LVESVRQHYLSLWGEPSRTAHFELMGREIEIYKWSAEINPQGVCLYATIGMCEHPIDGYDPTHRLELFVGLLPQQDSVARPLAMLALGPIIRGTQLAPDHTVTFPEPLWPGTELHGFIVRRQLEEVVPPLVLDSTHIEFLQAIPLFPSEVAFKSKNGADSLLRKWQDVGVPFWDPNRSPHPA
jgi:hypothetical protein